MSDKIRAQHLARKAILYIPSRRITGFARVCPSLGPVVPAATGWRACGDSRSKPRTRRES